MLRSTLTRRWQTTIPAEVRAALGLKPQQGLLYEIHGESVTLRPEGESLMDLAGVFRSDRPAVGKDDAREIARKRVAENFLRRDA